jgi:hypothetical protein
VKIMRIQKLVTTALLAGLLFGGIGEAVASQVLYDGIGMITGQQTITDSFSISGPGVLTVSLQDMTFPSPLASLNLVVGNPQGLLGPEMGAGTVSFKIGGPEQLYVQALATAEGPLDSGVYGLNVMFAPTAPVPLATSIAFLASGLTLFAWQRRQRRSPVPSPA